jgi:hypothetical protein
MAGLLRAWAGGVFFSPPRLHSVWMVPVAVLPQMLALHLPVSPLSDTVVPLTLVGSQALLLVFAWLNRKYPAFWIMSVGLAANFTVISLNGGLMPISPETIQQVAPELPPESLQIGGRLGATKDIVLPADSTVLWWLSDRFQSPSWSPYRFVFSLGDGLIAAGVLWLLWQSGSKRAYSVTEQ